MNPVVGLDVSKGESLSISHTREGLDTFHHFLKNVESITGKQPPVVLESTGPYQFHRCGGYGHCRLLFDPNVLQGISLTPFN